MYQQYLQRIFGESLSPLPLAIVSVAAIPLFPFTAFATISLTICPASLHPASVVGRITSAGGPSSLRFLSGRQFRNNRLLKNDARVAV
jgi:hypothetical protein